MADLEIQREFKEGVHEIFRTLFNDGVNSGVRYFPYITSDLNIYDEDRFRKFRKPYLLIAKVSLFPQQPEEYIEELKDLAHFVVPLQEFENKGISVTPKDLEEIRKGYFAFEGVLYDVIEIRPSAFVENVFLLYDVVCKPNPSITNLLVVDDTTGEEGVIEIDEFGNDG